MEADHESAIRNVLAPHRTAIHLQIEVLSIDSVGTDYYRVRVGTSGAGILRHSARHGHHAVCLPEQKIVALPLRIGFR